MKLIARFFNSWNVFTLAVVYIIQIDCATGIRPSSSSSASSSRSLNDLSLWIDERQVMQLSGVRMTIFAIQNGQLAPFLHDPTNLDRHLGVVPADVSSVNFTWKAGDRKKYYYHFDRLHSDRPQMLPHPTVSIPTTGAIPATVHTFQLHLSCHINSVLLDSTSVQPDLIGLTGFEFGFSVLDHQNKALPGTPLRFRLQKHCARTQKSPDPNCGRHCINGHCDRHQVCRCDYGYVGDHCEHALCYPPCQHGGTCIRPNQCQCPLGFQGPHCEGGICSQRCENGGKCVQKDRCQCSAGFYGNRCTFTLCSLPCLNNGRCVGVNECRCRTGFHGIQCEYSDNQQDVISKNALNTVLSVRRPIQYV